MEIVKLSVHKKEFSVEIERENFSVFQGESISTSRLYEKTFSILVLLHKVFIMLVIL